MFGKECHPLTFKPSKWCCNAERCKRGYESPEVWVPHSEGSVESSGRTLLKNAVQEAMMVIRAALADIIYLAVPSQHSPLSQAFCSFNVLQTLGGKLHRRIRETYIRWYMN